MKLHYKLAAISAFAFFIASCQEDEVLNLQQFPDNHGQITIDGEEGESTATILATYQSDGSLALDGPVTRNYTFNFGASPKDATVHFDIINSNIPSDKVSISTEDVTLPAGFATTGVTVSLENDDFSFATSNYEEETYELGVKATVQGYKMSQEPIESKVTIKKEAYKAAFFVVPEENQQTTFIRTYAFGKNTILEQDTITYQFHLSLDKPARQDVKVKLSTEGIQDEYKKDITISPSEIVIKAGQLTSEVVTWTIDNKFLLANDQADSFNIAIKATAECEDPVVYIDEKRNTVNLQVEKFIRCIGVVEAAKETWNILPKQGWEIIEPNGYIGYTPNLIDGNGGKDGTGEMIWNATVEFIVDMKETHTFHGFSIDYGPYPYSWDNPTPAAAAKKIMVSTSTDYQTWTNQGILEVDNLYSQYFECFAPIQAQYIKFTILDSHQFGFLYINEVYIYENK